MFAMVNRDLLTVNKDTFQYITEHLQATSQTSLLKSHDPKHMALGNKGGASGIIPADSILGDNTFVLRYSNFVCIGYDNVCYIDRVHHYRPCLLRITKRM